MHKVQTKQNHSIKLIFFARTFGDRTEGVFPLLNVFDVLTVSNVHKLQAVEFTDLWHITIYYETLPELVTRELSGYFIPHTHLSCLLFVHYYNYKPLRYTN